MVVNVHEFQTPPSEPPPEPPPPSQPDAPIPFTVNKVVVPEFPTDAFPTEIAAMIRQLAHATQTDPAMAGTAALDVLAACGGGHAEIEIRRGWREPLCLHTVVVASPGERKSGVQNTMSKPLRDSESHLSLAGEVARMAQKDALDLAEKKAERLRSAAATAAANAAKSDATDEDRKNVEAADKAALEATAAARVITVPAVPRLLADDVTPEAISSLLAEHGGRIAIISSEGGIFDTIAGRYARTVNIDVFLKGHAGDPIRVDRKGRPPEYIPKPALTVGLMIQPRVLEAIAANRDFSGRGLLARFLYARPQSKVGQREIGATPVEERVEKCYGATIATLASDMAGWAGDPAVIKLSPAAEAEVRRIEGEVESQLGEGGDLGAPSTLTEWGSKFVGAIVRIAGLLHLAQHGESGARSYPVQADTVKDAERIGAYFKACAIRTFNEMGADQVTGDAVYLLDRIVRRGQDDVSEREMFNISRARFPSMAAMTPALGRLVEHGYLTPEEPSKPTGGRPASPRYAIHPNAAKDAKEAKGRS